MIIARIGRPGEGKSLTTALDIRDWLDEGRTVYSNLHVEESRPNYRFFDTKDWEVIYQLRDGIIVFDEGQMLLDARNWEKLPIEFRQLLQKGRHEGLDFVVVTQAIMQVDVSARRLIHEATKVVKIFSSRKLNLGIFLLLEVDVHGLEKEKTTGFAGFRIALGEDWRYYDSHALRTKAEPLVPITCECGQTHRIKVSS